MSRLDEIPFSTSAYLADTQHLSLEQHGAYLLILMTMWRAGGWISDDERGLANICKSTPAKWRKIASDVRALLISKDGKLSQKRLLAELETESKRVEKNIANGRAGGLAKSLKSKDVDVATARVSPAVRQPVATIEPDLPLNIEVSKKDSESEKGRKKEEVRKIPTRLPTDWEPNEKNLTFASGRGLVSGRLDTEVEKFKNYWWAKPKEATKLDWDATWRTWVINALERNPAAVSTAPPRNGGPKFEPPPGCESIEQFRERMRKANAENQGTPDRGNAGVGQNGADRREELQLPSGGPLRGAQPETQRPTPDNHTHRR